MNGVWKQGREDELTINNNNPSGANSSSSGGSNMNPATTNRNLAQYAADARLLSEFEQSVESGKSFNYTSLLAHTPEAVDEQKMAAYLSKIQRGGFVQPFGCVIAFEEPSFRIISHSENCCSMLSLNLDSPDEMKTLLGIDARTLFTSSSRASLERAVASSDMKLLNPISVYSKTSKPFYAILHRIDVGVLIDLEPANSSDPTVLFSGAVQSQKLAVRAISRLQSLPGGDIGAMCDAIVEEVQKLTGYDRVMVYKFHDDGHGEVVSEVKRSDLEPYLGLHYPATDIPQAVRFLFKQNRLYMELQLAEQKTEKKILRMQTALCDMLLQDDPFRIITHSPSIMDLVKCDGAALYYDNKVWLIGATPNESQIADIVKWLCDEHKDFTGFSTESLLNSDYPGAVLLGDAICGMVAARIAPKDFMFWFRAQSEKEIKWAGAKHHPGDKDDGDKMRPRSSFKAFLEVVKGRSFPWEDSEINTIQSLQLILQTPAQDVADKSDGSQRVMKYSQQSQSEGQNVDEISSVACEMTRLIETASVPIFGVDMSGFINGWNEKIAELTGVDASEAIGKPWIDEFVHESSREVVEDLLYRALQAMEELTGHMKHEVLGKVLAGEVFGGLCPLKDEDTLTKFMILLYRAIEGHDASDFPFGFFGKDGNFVEVYLTTNKRVGENGKVVGCFCFLRTSVQMSLGDTKGDQELALNRDALAYIKQEIKNPLNGLLFTRRLLENSATSDHQKQYLETSGACERQIASLIENMDIKSIEEGNVELNSNQFVIENILDAILSQVMIVLKEKNISLVHEIPNEAQMLDLIGDQIRLQMILSDFLISIVNHAPSPDGWVEIKVSPGLRMIQDGHEYVQLQFRMTHPGPGIPADIIKDMCGERKNHGTQEGLALNLSRKLLHIMKGHVHYVRDDTKCCFLIDIELKTRK
ncbi:hypothetical protein SSX86_027104 [Deinandra increscens subsp. villosa]|uniref:Phytochrome n=1 Tax=Deinandra increscens subsp. villosa TaxID=3103831 RepID=A0AAP0CLI2_9ASTR